MKSFFIFLFSILATSAYAQTNVSGGIYTDATFTLASSLKSTTKGNIS